MVNELAEIDGVGAPEELLVGVLDELLDELDGADDFELLDELLPQAATATLAITASATVSALLLSRCTRIPPSPTTCAARRNGRWLPTAPARCRFEQI